jgi:TrmH family RNA methyltransferase
MLSKNTIKTITSLHHKKFRKKEGLFIAEGEKVCRELIHAGWNIAAVYVTEAFRNEKYIRWVKKVNAEIISEKDFEKISALSTSPEILVVAKIPDQKFDFELLDHKLTLALDQVKDPGNLGTIIRIADWFGIENILCSENCADAFNPKTVQASMGSLFRVKVFYDELVYVLMTSREKNIDVYGTMLDGENIYSAALNQEGIIVIGNESNGISNALLPYINRRISIPSFSPTEYKAESLNAAMAAAIVCSEFRRR